MGRRWFDDLTGDDLADDDVHSLVVTLDGDPLAAYDVGRRPAPELLAELGSHLLDTIVVRTTPSEPLDPGPLDESAGYGPSGGHDDPWSQVSEPDPVDESAKDPPSAAQSIESPAVSVKPPVADTTAAPVAVSGTTESQRVGEATAGAATDATVRRWALAHDIPCSTTGGLKAWVREAYERVDGKVPDFDARRRARAAGAKATTPSVRPEVAGADTVATWCLRNGVEDRGGRVTVLGRQAYAEAWRAAHPDEKPPAASEAPTGEGPPAPDERAGQAATSGAGTVNGSVRPPIEPIGDGTGQPPSSPDQLARADELAADGKTPRQICSEAGVWLSEARAAVRKATER